MTRVAPSLLSEQAGLSTAGGSVGDFIALLKPRVMSLVVFSGFAGLAVAPGDIHPLIGAVAVLCIAVGAGASGAINMWYDRDIDAVMRRTRHRPLPAGRMEPGAALGFGCFLAAAAGAVVGRAVHRRRGARLIGGVLDADGRGRSGLTPAESSSARRTSRCSRFWWRSRCC